MRHKISGNRLNRKSSHRKATIRDLAKATLIEQRICTTKAKAKEARKLVDKLITMGKKGTLAEKRRAFAVLCNHQLVSELFSKTAPRFKNRIGGYTRIIPLGNRRGDNAELAFLELTEKEEIIISKQKAEASTKKNVKPSKASAKSSDVKTAKEAKSVDFSDVSQTQSSDKPSKKSKKSEDSAETEKGSKGKKILGDVKKIFNRKTGK